jgi:diacylglycerol kinase family enzyme
MNRPARALAPRARLHFVLNGAAGDQDDAALLQSLEQVLGEAGRPFELHRVPQPGALARTAQAAAAQAGADGVVVAVGGDGTLNTVVSALLDSPVVLGLVPRGTFNYVARANGIPLDAAEALRLLLHGRAHAVQVGRLNDRPFLVNASLGLYPELLEDREAFKQRYGRTRLVALGAALRSLLRVHPRLALHIQADGQAPRVMRASTLFVGNNPLQIEALGLPEAAQVGESALVALVLRAFRPGELLWLALRGALGRLGEAEDLTHFAFQTLAVRPRLPLAQRRLKVALDGEVLRLRPPLLFAVDERPLWLIRPEPGDSA